MYSGTRPYAVRDGACNTHTDTQARCGMVSNDYAPCGKCAACTVIPSVGRIDNVSRETIDAYYVAEQDAPSLSVPSWVQRAIAGALPCKDFTRG